MAWRKPTNVREWLGIVLRHKKKAFYPAVVVASGVVIGSLWYPREYYAEARFERRNDVVLDTTGAGVLASELSGIRQRVLDNIKGRAAIEQLIADRQQMVVKRPLAYTPDGQLTAEGQMVMNDIISRLQRQVTVYPVAQTAQIDQYVVSFSDSDPNLAPVVINQLVENYINKTRQQLAERLLNARQFFEQERGRYAQLLQDLERKLLTFKKDHDGLKIDNPGGLRKDLEDARKKLAELTLDLETSRQERVARLKAHEAEPDEIEVKGFQTNPEMEQLRQQVSLLMAEIQKLREGGRKDEHPLVKNALTRLQRVKDQMAKTQAQVEQVKERMPNVRKKELKDRADALSAKMVALEGQIKEVNAEFERLDTLDRNFYAKRNEYLQLENDVNDAKGQLQFWDDSLRRTRTAIQAELAQKGLRLSITQRATGDLRPAKPAWTMILGAALAAGLAVAVVMVVLAELLDRSYHSVDQAIDDLKLPVLGAINEIVTPGLALRRRILALGVFPAITIFLLLVLAGSCFVAYLSLERPTQYAELIATPDKYLKDYLRGQP